MSFQKCPLCEGTGDHSESICQVCDGRRIINSETGRPPAVETEPEHVELTDEQVAELLKPLSPFDDISDEEIQYWATPYYDEIQERKEAQKKAREEKE